MPRLGRRRSVVLLLAVAMVVVGCGDDKGGDRSGSTTGAGPAGSGDDATVSAPGATAVRTDGTGAGDVSESESSAVPSAPTGPAGSTAPGGPDGDLSGFLLTAGDLEGTWESVGAEPLSGFAEGGTVGPICPEGDTATLADPERTVAAPGNAYITFTAPDQVDSYITEILIHDGDGSVFEALSSAFDSCIGEPFEQGSDPVETVQYERLDVPGLGDHATGFLERWGTGGELDGGEVAHVLVSTDELLVAVSVGREGVTDPFDQGVLEAASTAAVERVASM